MKSSIRDLFLVTMIVALAPATVTRVARAEDEREKSPASKENKQRRIVARDSYAWMQMLDPKEIPELEHGKDLQRALTAAWVRARASASPISAARFVGFMEAKIEAELPWDVQWDIYSSCRAQSSAPAANAGDEFDFQRASLFDKKCYLRAGHVLTLEADGKLRYERGKDAVRFDAELLRSRTPYHDFIQLWPFQDVALLAAYDDTGSPFRLWCLRRTDGKMLWTQVVWADQADMILTKSGSWRHSVHMTSNGDRVLVLGTNRSFYCESFDLKSGQNRFRFSSSCWNGRRASFFVGPKEDTARP